MHMLLERTIVALSVATLVGGAVAGICVTFAVSPLQMWDAILRVFGWTWPAFGMAAGYLLWIASAAMSDRLGLVRARWEPSTTRLLAYIKNVAPYAALLVCFYHLVIALLTLRGAKDWSEVRPALMLELAVGFTASGIGCALQVAAQSLQSLIVHRGRG